MKAFILAAGFGTRLLPHTKTLPKPLFKVNNEPLIKKLMDSLINFGVKEIFINTHHLHNQIEDYVLNQNFKIPVKTVYEDEILNTGGGILNILKYIGDDPFFVINSDIYTDVNFLDIFNFHIENNNDATLCLCKNRFNNVKADKEKILGFETEFSNDYYTFTGIQVISSKISNFFETKKSSIEAYKKMIQSNLVVSPFFISQKNTWDDLGTMDSFGKKNIEILIENKKILDIKNAEYSKIEGDGSDRKWMRIKDKNRSIIAVDHGIELPLGSREAKSFIKIGNHLFNKNIPVPKIYTYDFFSGTIILEDLGDLRLQDHIKDLDSEKKIDLLKDIIDKLFIFSEKGDIGFTKDMPWQTNEYDQELSFNECIYFRDEFLKNYLHLNFNEEKLNRCFQIISKNIEKDNITGLMHRDFQSRNIMIKNNKPYFIDFQGARRGPLQYDLASFIIDPYIKLSKIEKNALIDYAADKAYKKGYEKAKFIKAFYFSAVSRNLQILGAFSFLSLKKNKNYFKLYIPTAIESLNNLLLKIDNNKIQYLKEIVLNIKEADNWKK